MGDRQRPRLTILVKLLLAFTLPTMALFAVFAVFALAVAERDLEQELGRRLSAVAAAASSQVRGKYLVDLLPEDQTGDTNRRRLYDGAKRKLEQVAKQTGVARIYVFDRQFTSRVDTDPSAEIRARYFQAELDRAELARVFDSGAQTSGLLFQGTDGVQYKTGYAPIYADPETEPEVVLAIGVDAPATFFERLASLRRNLLLYGVLLALAVVLIAVFVAARITRPIRGLVAAAELIGGGDLETPVARMSRDELGFLAHAMDDMRRDVRDRDVRMQQMLAGVAHEVRNPLGGMELFAGILREELPGDGEHIKHVLRIEKEIGYLKRVVDDFLDYARRAKPQLSDLDLGVLAEEVCELEINQARGAGVELVAETTDVSCRGDVVQLRRVVLNLVRNAVEAATGANRARVVVSVDRTEGRARVRVSNPGPPIPADVQERIFEPFFTTREKGTGLGLAFVREIVEDHRGTIGVTSDEASTVFSFEIPL